MSISELVDCKHITWANHMSIQMNQTSKGWNTTCMVHTHTQLFSNCNQVTCCPFLGELQVCTTMQHDIIVLEVPYQQGLSLFSCTAMMAAMCPFGLLPNIYRFLFFQQNSHYHYHQHLQHHQIVSIIMGSKTLITIALINCCNLSMPHHAMQPHHHHRIQTANPKKQKQWVHTHTHHTHIPITSERTEQKPHTTWFCYQDHLLCQHVCVCVRLCVWIQGKISILPAGVKNPGLPPLHSDTRSEESTWEPLMWK